MTTLEAPARQRRWTVKPTKHAALICTIATVLAAIGILLGLLTEQPLWVIGFLLPAAGYEVYRTAGASTKWASWAMLAVLVAEAVLIIFGINWDFAEFLGQDSTYVGGQYVPLGDIQVLAPVLLAVLSLILALRTRGIYTRWLAGVILVTALVLVHVLNPEIFADLLRSTVLELFNSV